MEPASPWRRTPTARSRRPRRPTSRNRRTRAPCRRRRTRPPPTAPTRSCPRPTRPTSLQSLATVTPEEATAAALAAVPGTAGDATLEDENGYVVYEVQVTAADGSVIEVKVDAGDASVLAQEADEPECTDEATENGTEQQDETGENGAEDPNT
ncbi:PepSY domain-containing protein [Microbacterium profundi]|uniref:PepSY domain-containing protein n=1 Tax=Microbacterium profundi TaxID=450380 RepID=UPI0027E1E062|nr:PepSY domain-containing protein [Microbacterium profundi]